MKDVWELGILHLLLERKVIIIIIPHRNLKHRFTKHLFWTVLWAKETLVNKTRGFPLEAGRLVCRRTSKQVFLVETDKTGTTDTSELLVA